jgi:hypothetical protein
MESRATTDPLGARRGRRLWWAGIGLVCALHVHLLFRSAEQQSVTFDEYAHLPAGVAYWKTGRFEPYYQNPPLMKLLFGGAAVLANVNFPGIPPGEETLRWRQGERFLRANFQAYPDIFVFCRLVPILLSAVGALLVARWSWRLYGPPAALLATVLYCACPNICAHANLVTIDLGATVIILAAAYAYWKFLCFGRWRALVSAGVLIGLAQYCKFTALLLFPILLVVTLAGLPLTCRGRTAARRPAAGLLRGRHVKGLPLRAWRRPRRALLGVPVVGLMSLVIVDAGYLFSGVGRQLSDYEFESAACKAVQRTFGGVPVPLPSAYVAGFDSQNAEAAGPNLTYVHGRLVPEDVWYYFPLALLVKTPMAFVPLILLRTWISIRRARQRPRRWTRSDMYLLALPALFAAGFVFATPIKIGIRYLLPCAPFIYIWLGGLLAAPRAAHGKLAAGLARPQPAPCGTRWVRGGVLAPAVVALAAAFAIEAQHVHPRYLSFFNQAAGGPSNGYRWFCDSNLDWGQGLIDLRDFMQQRGIQHMQLAYFGSVDPSVYGIGYAPLFDRVQEEWVGVSAYFWSGMAHRLPTPGGPTEFFVSGTIYADVCARAPVALVGDTIFIYRFPEFVDRRPLSDPRLAR